MNKLIRKILMESEFDWIEDIPTPQQYIKFCDRYTNDEIKYYLYAINDMYGIEPKAPWKFYRLWKDIIDKYDDIVLIYEPDTKEFKYTVCTNFGTGSRFPSDYGVEVSDLFKSPIKESNELEWIKDPKNPLHGLKLKTPMMSSDANPMIIIDKGDRKVIVRTHSKGDFEYDRGTVLNLIKNGSWRIVEDV
jgi:hypothetical protein